MSIFCSLQLKTLRLSWKDRNFFEKPQSFSLLLLVSLFPQIFTKNGLALSLSLSLSLSRAHVRLRNSTKSALYLFAIDEQVLDLDELDTSKEDLEFGVHRITM